MTIETRPQPEPPLELVAEGVTKRFGDHQVLHGIDLEVESGQMVAIIGGSGCGKTVFLHCLVALLEVTAGRVWAADHEREGNPLVDVTAMDEHELDELRVHWAMVFQKNALFSDTVYENIAVWLREIRGASEEQIRKRAIRALSAVGFDPDDQLLAKHRSELSGGMAKRVALARAIAMDPIVTFYDEPTTGLDPYLSAEVQDTIQAIHQAPTAGGSKRTTLIITHDKDLLARLAPRVIMLDRGHIVFDGRHEEFIHSDEERVQPYLSVMPKLQRGQLQV